MPLQAQPTFHEYCEWVRLNRGCIISKTDFPSEPGFPAGVTTRIDAPSGKHVLQANLADNALLVDRQIKYLDRRLNIESPWGAV